MRYYIGSLDFKWSHVGTSMEEIWVRRELGDELYKQCNQDGFNLHYDHTDSLTLPNDMYCTCEVSVDVPDSNEGLLFQLQYPHVKVVS